jgi:VWFA-related protein
VLVLGFGWPAAAQQTGVSRADLLFGEEIDVRVINLEVVVENRAGERVTGLDSDDFRLLVDGDEVDVEYFTEVRGKRALASGGSGSPPSIGEGETVATNYVLFVDDDHSQVTLRRPVLIGFRDRLAELPAGDQVAVVVQSGRQLEILSPFTTDREATRRALAQLDKGGRFGGFLRTQRRLRLADDRGSPGSGDAAPSRDSVSAASIRGEIDSEELAQAESYAGEGSLDPEVRWPASGVATFAPLGPQGIRTFGLGGWVPPDMQFRDMQFSVDAVVSTMRALDPPEGRKVFLLLAGSWPSGDLGLASIGKSTDLHLLDALIDTANLLGYTVYPMDQQGGLGGWLWANMRYVARGTGGRAFMAGSNVRALEIVNADTSDYYWLGFVPEYRRDDRVHDIEVQVRHPGVQVRARRGYLDLSGVAEADMEAQRHLLFPRQPEADEIRLRVRTGTATSLRGKRMSVPVDVGIPVGSFTAVPWDGRYVQRLEVRFATIDRDGWRAEQPAIPLDLRHDAAPSQDGVHWFRADLEMRHLPHTVVVTVHDPVSRQTASARIEVKP